MEDSPVITNTLFMFTRRLLFHSIGGLRRFSTTDVRWTVVYADGSCKNNGTKSAVAGIGVYFGENDQRNVSRTLPVGTRHTSQRAELTAAIEALNAVPRDEALEIRTDSSYVVKGITRWIHRWIQNEFKTSRGKPVANQDLWRQFLEETEKRPGGLTKFVWIRGHADTRCSDQRGNDQANYLAGVAVGLVPDKPLKNE